MFAAVMTTPPRATNPCRFASPCQPSPGRMSSVCAHVPMFGVSGVFFHGIGLRHIGSPSTIDETLPPRGRKDDRRRT